MTIIRVVILHAHFSLSQELVELVKAKKAAQIAK